MLILKICHIKASCLILRYIDLLFIHAKSILCLSIVGEYMNIIKSVNDSILKNFNFVCIYLFIFKIVRIQVIFLKTFRMLFVSIKLNEVVREH